MSQYPMDDLDKQIAMLKREIDEKNDQKKTEKDLSTTSYAVQGPMPGENHGQANFANKLEEEKREIDARSIFVRGLDWNTTSEDITEFLSECGTVDKVTLLQDRFTNRPKGHAYVSFTDVEGASNAIATKNLALLRGRTLTITKKRTNVPGMKRHRAPTSSADPNAVAAAAATASMMAGMAQGMNAGAENPFMNFMSMMMRPPDAPVDGFSHGRGGPRGYGRGMAGRGMRGRGGRGMPPYM